jgi:glycosyltransferase involved in cell wall biosynthesis
MQRFAEIMRSQLEARGHKVRLLRPPARFNRSGASPSGAAKWLGYIDKFLIFPPILKRAVRRTDVVHIVDHSNASYVHALRRTPHLVTCNDVLAIRSALGDFAQNPTGWSGKLLQRMILNGLSRSQHIACISENTRGELLRICPRQAQQVTTIYMGQNYSYTPMPPTQAREQVGSLFNRDVVESKFILHVGGNQWYKNRMGVLRTYAHLHWMLGREYAPLLIMAGKPLTDEMCRFVDEHHLQKSVISVENVTNEELRALYSLAQLLLFPSLAEGFGWPIVEAQACGCRVVTTARPPMTEVGGSAAVYLEPERESIAAEQVASVLSEDNKARAARIEAGLRNAERFSTTTMIEAYLSLYQKLMGEAARYSG